MGDLSFDKGHYEIVSRVVGGKAVDKKNEPPGSSNIKRGQKDMVTSR